MRVIRPALLIALLAGCGLFQPQAVLAAQRPSDMPLYAGEMDRFLSPNELQLAELQRERQDLLEQRESEKNIRILKNKITILNNKIAFLQRQIKLTKPYMVTQRLVPIKVKGAQSAERLEPVEAPVVKRALVQMGLASCPPFGSEKREDAVLGVLPRKLTPKALTTPALRESAVTEALPVKPIQQTLPIKMSLQTFKAVAARETASTQALPVKAQEQPAAAVTVKHKQGSGKTGAEWKKMALADKEIYILSVMGNLSRRDVYLMKPYSFYIENIDQAIEKNPLLEQEFVHRILMTTAYDSEPDTRKDLEKVWK